MVDLHSLIRLRRHRVEEKQKVIADLYRQVDVIEQRKSDIRNRLEHEQKALENHEIWDAAEYYGRFAEMMRGQIEKLDQELTKIELRIQIAQEDMRTAFSEFKQVEIAQRRRDEKAKAEIKKQEERDLDDMGIEGYRRGQE